MRIPSSELSTPKTDRSPAQTSRSALSTTVAALAISLGAVMGSGMFVAPVYAQGSETSPSSTVGATDPVFAADIANLFPVGNYSPTEVATAKALIANYLNDVMAIPATEKATMTVTNVMSDLQERILKSELPVSATADILATLAEVPRITAFIAMGGGKVLSNAFQEPTDANKPTSIGENFDIFSRVGLAAAVIEGKGRETKKPLSDIPMGEEVDVAKTVFKTMLTKSEQSFVNAYVKEVERFPIPYSENQSLSGRVAAHIATLFMLEGRDSRHTNITSIDPIEVLGELLVNEGFRTSSDGDILQVKYLSLALTSGAEGLKVNGVNPSQKIRSELTDASYNLSDALQPFSANQGRELNKEFNRNILLAGESKITKDTGKLISSSPSAVTPPAISPQVLSDAPQAPVQGIVLQSIAVEPADNGVNVPALVQSDDTVTTESITLTSVKTKPDFAALTADSFPAANSSDDDAKKAKALIEQFLNDMIKMPDVDKAGLTVTRVMNDLQNRMAGNGFPDSVTADIVATLSKVTFDGAVLASSSGVAGYDGSPSVLLDLFARVGLAAAVIEDKDRETSSAFKPILDNRSDIKAEVMAAKAAFEPRKTEAEPLPEPEFAELMAAAFPSGNHSDADAEKAKALIELFLNDKMDMPDADKTGLTVISVMTDLQSRIDASGLPESVTADILATFAKVPADGAALAFSGKLAGFEGDTAALSKNIDLFSRVGLAAVLIEDKGREALAPFKVITDNRADIKAEVDTAKADYKTKLTKEEQELVDAFVESVTFFTEPNDTHPGIEGRAAAQLAKFFFLEGREEGNKNPSSFDAVEVFGDFLVNEGFTASDIDVYAAGSMLRMLEFSAFSLNGTNTIINGRKTNTILNGKNKGSGIPKRWVNFMDNLRSIPGASLNDYQDSEMAKRMLLAAEKKITSSQPSSDITSEISNQVETDVAQAVEDSVDEAVQSSIDESIDDTIDDSIDDVLDDDLGDW